MRKWRKVMAVGCTHGELIDIDRRNEVLAFAERWKPETRFDLGDIVDVAALRGGARGTPDEARDPRPDVNAAVEWINLYRPTHVAYGNHDARMVELMHSPNALVALAASTLWTSIDDAVRKVGAETRPYDIEKGWFDLGGYKWGHGYMFNEHALRDHAEMVGPCVIAHLHYEHIATGRTINARPSFCVGTLANIPAFSYARRRRATLRWGHGVVWGEYCGNEAHLHLTQSRPGESLRFPV